MERVTYASFPSRLMVGYTYRTPCRSNASCAQPPVTLSPYTSRTPYRRTISAASRAVASRLRTPLLGFSHALPNTCSTLSSADVLPSYRTPASVKASSPCPAASSAKMYRTPGSGNRSRTL